MYKFEKLLVWNEALVLVELSYEVNKKLPSYEINGLGDQLRRAVTSIAINIAEGSGGSSDADFLKFLHISRKSLYEVVAILKLAERLHKVDINKALEQTEKTGKILSGLIRSLKSSD